MIRLARILARFLLAIAGVLLVTAIVVAAAALAIAALPYRRLRGPSVIGARIAAGQQIVLALAALAATRRRDV